PQPFNVEHANSVAVQWWPRCGGTYLICRERVVDFCRRWPGIALVALGVALACGCGEETVQTYTVEKGSEAIGGEISAGSPAEVSAPRVEFEPVWVVPDGWRAVEEERAMRLATYLMPGPDGDVEVAITRVAGDAGGM